MTDLISQDNLTIREMENIEADYQLMLHWLTNPKLLEFYEGRDIKFTLELIKEKYEPRILGKAKVHPCIVQLEDIPIGYIQYSDITDDYKEKFDLPLESNSFGIDLFIGDSEYWGKGIGTKMLSLMVNYLFRVLEADYVTIDPKIHNERAIKSYEKVGFKKMKILENHEFHEGVYHDNWLMSIDRDSYSL